MQVIEHSTDFTKAVGAGREASNNNPRSYFVDDVHPLFVYLPCGIGGSPSEIIFGLKQVFGAHVHCFFVEPAKMPSLLVSLETELFDKISVSDLGLGEITVADATQFRELRTL